jgi:uncharacterized membrane protein
MLHYLADGGEEIVMKTRCTSGSHWVLAALRFVALFALAVWVGGIVFLGAIMAPAAFGISRALGPQLVGAALARFTPATYICGVLMLLAWAGEGGLNRRRSGRNESRVAGHKLWWAQGACMLVMLAVALYLGRVLTPRLNSLQPPAINAITRGAPLRGTDKAAFDAAHQRYTQLTKLNLWLGIATLFLLSLRTSAFRPRQDEEYTNSTPPRRKASKVVEKDRLAEADVR